MISFKQFIGEEVTPRSVAIDHHTYMADRYDRKAKAHPDATVRSAMQDTAEKHRVAADKYEKNDPKAIHAAFAATDSWIKTSRLNRAHRKASEANPAF